VIPAPRDVSQPIGQLVLELEHHIGTSGVVSLACDLLSGGDRAAWEPELVYLNGLTDTAGWPTLWPRVWGARALLYVWDPSAIPAVVAGLSDEAWRVAEMCLKVATRHEVAEAADQAVGYTSHELARVRSNAVRLLGVAGEHEHLDAVHQRLADDDESVRRHAARALERLEGRLDLT
jgi:HEAT repeat protein